jgi:hypothetical protein
MRTPWGIPSRREQAGEQADQKRAGDIDEQLILMNSVPQGKTLDPAAGRSRC